jgi:acetyl esterase/lipase
MKCHYVQGGMILTFLVRSIGGAELPNLNALTPDLVVPNVVMEEVAAGRRVEATTTGWEGTDVRHTLYLPRNWRPDLNFPVIVEFAGNGGYRNNLGDTSDGTVEGCVLGYGLSGGEDFIWVCLPFVDVAADGTKHNCSTWWGDLAETKRFSVATVREVCKKYGGDVTKVVICGFSRGAIACNYIGLHDDEIAGLWCSFFCHSHYDGVRAWQYVDSDAASALKRLQRLHGREQWISHEVSVRDTSEYLEKTGVHAPFTFVPIPFANHSAAWVLRDIPERRQARQWLSNAIKSPQTNK